MPRVIQSAMPKHDHSKKPGVGARKGKKKQRHKKTSMDDEKGTSINEMKKKEAGQDEVKELGEALEAR